MLAHSSKLDSRRGRRVLLVVAVVVALFATVLLTPPGAGARRRRKARPVLLAAPELVHYGDRARIVGKLENGRPGQNVFLKRRYREVGKAIIRKKRIKKNRKVKFFLPNRTLSADYRLILHPGKRNERVSKAARVEVTPRLTFDIDPNDVKTRRGVELSGRLLPVVEGRKARIERRVDGEWEVLKKVDAGDGIYKRFYDPDVRGRRDLRVVFVGDELNAPAKRRERLWIYRRGEATWYGPGLYGNQTACGQTLRKKTLGVAHRLLPCGTKVDFLYKQRTVTVRVIDRGPHGEADWDLTRATKARLHFEGRDEVGFIAH